MSQTFIGFFAVVLLAGVVGCSGGPLTTREKGAGIGPLGARRWALLLAPPWERRALAPLSVVLLVLAPAR